MIRDFTGYSPLKCCNYPSLTCVILNREHEWAHICNSSFYIYVRTHKRSSSKLLSMFGYGNKYLWWRHLWISGCVTGTKITDFGLRDCSQPPSFFTLKISATNELKLKLIKKKTWHFSKNNTSTASHGYIQQINPALKHFLKKKPPTAQQTDTPMNGESENKHR